MPSSLCLGEGRERGCFFAMRIIEHTEGRYEAGRGVRQGLQVVPRERYVQCEECGKRDSFCPYQFVDHLRSAARTIPPVCGRSWFSRCWRKMKTSTPGDTSAPPSTGPLSTKINPDGCKLWAGGDTARAQRGAARRFGGCGTTRDAQRACPDGPIGQCEDRPRKEVKRYLAEGVQGCATFVAPRKVTADYKERLLP